MEAVPLGIELNFHSVLEFIVCKITPETGVYIAVLELKIVVDCCGAGVFTARGTGLRPFIFHHSLDCLAMGVPCNQTTHYQKDDEHEGSELNFIFRTHGFSPFQDRQKTDF